MSERKFRNIKAMGLYARGDPILNRLDTFVTAGL